MIKDLTKWQEIYENNKKLDSIFDKKYEPFEENLYEKNCIEFLVEFGEFINETKCFKYWSIKRPKREEMLEEYADCLTMILYFYNVLKMPLTGKLKEHYYNDNLLEIINYIYRLSTRLLNNLTPDLVEEIFSNLIYIGALLGFEEEDVILATKKKHEKVCERLNSDY